MSSVSHTAIPDLKATQVPTAAPPKTTENQEESRPGAPAVYLALMKPKIISLLLITTVGAMFVASQGLPDLKLLFWTIVGGTLSAGGANALNNYFDRDIDTHMYRTKRRPIPAGWVAPGAAVLFGVALCTLSFFVFYTQVNLLAAVLSLGGALYYIFLYTLWLKRRTHHNITIGGVAGAIPPLVGWAAVTGSLDLTAWALFAIIFFWTPPHTWALTLMVKRDYARVNVPMLPVVVGEEETRRQIIIYSWVFFLVTLLIVPLGLFGWFYLLAALVTGGIFLRDAYKVKNERNKASARSLYQYSLLHLALLFLAMVVDSNLPNWF